MKKIDRIKKLIDQQAIGYFVKAKPTNKKALADHVAKLGIELLANAHEIVDPSSMSKTRAKTFVDRDTGEVAAFLEHEDPTDEECPDCGQHHEGESPNAIDMIALLSHIQRCADDFKMAPQAVIEHMIGNMNAWRNPPPEAFN